MFFDKEDWILETSASSGLASAVRIKVTDTRTKANEVLTLLNENSEDAEEILRAIRAKVAELAYRKVATISVSVTAITIGQAVADHSRDQSFGGAQAVIAKSPCVPQLLTLVVNNENVSPWPNRPLFCERRAFLAQVKRVTGFKLQQLLRARQSFVVYSRLCDSQH
jgi:hypothetical protein